MSPDRGGTLVTVGLTTSGTFWYVALQAVRTSSGESSHLPGCDKIVEYWNFLRYLPNVRPRLVATPPYRATLAGCSWASRVQTRRHGVQLPARSSASVPRGIVPTSRRCRITATSSVRHPTAPDRTASPAQLLWPSGFLCGWSVGLEFPAGQLAESDYWRNSFRQSLKTFMFATYWCIQRIRGFTTMRYINQLFTYLLTKCNSPPINGQGTNFILFYVVFAFVL